MKKIIFLSLLLCSWSLFANSQQLTVVTYNLRGDDPKDVGNEWAGRKFMVTDQIERFGFDLMGMQETNAKMVGYLTSALPRLDSIGEFGKIGTGILFNKKRLQLLDHGLIWLSPTPETESKGWDAKFKRICAWGKFKDLATGVEYYVFNSHFDHIGVVARTNSTALLLQKVKEIAGDKPTIFMGDLNTGQYDPNYITFNNSGFLKDSYDLAINHHEKDRGTGNGFNINRRQRIRVDHIFLSSTLQAFEYDVLTGLYNNHTTSDHYAVMAKIGPKINELGDLYRQFPEDFENIIPKTNYGNGKVEARTGTWILNGAILGGSSANDKPTSGTYAVRMVNGNTASAYLQMNFDVNEGASKVTVQHGIYATDSVSRWQLEYSTNQGSSWFPTGPVVVAHQGNKQQAVFIMDIRGKVRFRINKIGLGADDNGRLSIDDFTIYKRKNTEQEKKNMTLLAWQFGIPITSGREVNANSSFTAKGLNTSTLTRGTGLITKTTTGWPISLPNGFAAAANVATATSVIDTTAAIANNLYFEFKVAPTVQQKVSLSTIDARLMATGKAKKLWYWKYSLDGANFKFLAKPYEFAALFPTSQNTIDLSIYPELQNLTAAQIVYFRLYVNGLDGEEDIVGFSSSDKYVKNGTWPNPEIAKDYVLQLNGFVETLKSKK